MAENSLDLPLMDSIQRWQGISAPNSAARYGLKDLEGLIAALAKLRGELVFEDEPASFEAALTACKEPQA
ncbi:hypothetical protein [Roseococcus sp.]|uniref:hypothetical protein n=1 Tax=Roseococcus sp. TaxID=2109646 RepID=UPI003BAAC817